MMNWFTSVSTRTRTGLLAAAALALPATACLAQPEVMTKDGVISGTMDITFNTRTNKDSSGDLVTDSPALGAKDRYAFKLSVVETLEFSGEITRQPNLYSKLIRSRKQSAQMWYNVAITVKNSKDLKQSKTVGKWVGTVPIDEKSGKYDLAGGRSSESPLRFDIDAVGKGTAFKDLFSGYLVGKAEKKDNLAEYTYRRLVAGKTVEYKVKKSDPLRFENLQLAKGPVEVYPATLVGGTLNYDYETGNYFADNITFKYALDGKDYTDVVTGTIKWVEDPDRKTNGKGFYEFNVRFNEDKNKAATGESAAFDKLSDEDAFFAVDNSIPSLTGKIAYTDTMSGGSDEPTSSKVTYTLNGNKLTKQQVVNFFKLWLVAVGPTNDE